MGIQTIRGNAVAINRADGTLPAINSDWLNAKVAIDDVPAGFTRTVADNRVTLTIAAPGKPTIVIKTPDKLLATIDRKWIYQLYPALFQAPVKPAVDKPKTTAKD
jgi:hypothetical protein